VPRVLVVGSANVDFTVAVARLPRPGETVSGGTLLVNHGGKGANQAVAARRLGGDVAFVGCVGADAAGAAVRDALTREGIDATGIAVSTTAATGTALIIVDAEGRNQIAVAPGANHDLSPAHVGDVPMEGAAAVVCQLETPLPTVRSVLETARRLGARTLMNPAPVPAAPVDLWPLVDFLTPNAGEAERFTGIAVNDPETAAAAAARFREWGVGTVVVTLGEHGALACGPHGVLHVPGFAVAAVDTTAAGDAFNGALALAIADGRALAESLRFANATAALACTRRGAQASLPMRAEADALLARALSAERAP
jgi:ribokinase